MQKKFSFESLSGSKEFKEVLSGKKLNSHLFTIFYKLKNFNDKKNSIQLSCVAAKKLGNAVKRNKIKRRLRNIMNDAYKKISINLNYSYLVIAKSTMLNNNFTNIKETLFQEFEKIK